MKTSKKIIIIEDEKALARALKLKLSHSGFEVKVAYNGEDGIACLEKEPFDLIVLDLLMPKMDGFTVLKKLKEKNILIPVMVLSNLIQDSDVKRIKEFKVKEFFIKSNTPLAIVVKRISKLLNQKIASV